MIQRRRYYLWRLVDQDGYILDENLQKRRYTKTTKRLLTRLLSKQGIGLKRIPTDKPGSYGTAKRKAMPTVEHHSHKGLNNRAKLAFALMKTRARHAEVQVTGPALKISGHLLQPAQSLRSCSSPTFCNRHSPSSHQRFRSMETGCNA